MGEERVGGGLYLRLGAVAAAVDNLMELPEMAEGREKAGGAAT